MFFKILFLSLIVYILAIAREISYYSVLVAQLLRTVYWWTISEDIAANELSCLGTNYSWYATVVAFNRCSLASSQNRMCCIENDHSGFKVQPAPFFNLLPLVPCILRHRHTMPCLLKSGRLKSVTPLRPLEVMGLHLPFYACCGNWTFILTKFTTK